MRAVRAKQLREVARRLSPDKRTDAVMTKKVKINKKKWGIEGKEGSYFFGLRTLYKPSVASIHRNLKRDFTRHRLPINWINHFLRTTNKRAA